MTYLFFTTELRSSIMEVFDAIHTRRTIARFQSRPVSPDLLKRVLEAGLWAPNHHLTEPWRFTVAGPEAMRVLAERSGKAKTSKMPNESPERLARLHDEVVAKFLANPVLVIVTARQEGDELKRREDYAATCCAIQNIQLAAWAEGLGTKWGTGILTRQPATYELLGLDLEKELIVGFLYMGYPDESPAAERKRTLDEVIRWSA